MKRDATRFVPARHLSVLFSPHRTTFAVYAARRDLDGRALDAIFVGLAVMNDIDKPQIKRISGVGDIGNLHFAVGEIVLGHNIIASYLCTQISEHDVNAVTPYP